MSIHYKINVTLNNEWRYRVYTFKHWKYFIQNLIYLCDQAKDVYMSRLQVFSICLAIGPFNQVIIFSFHQILQKSNLNTTFFSWLASQRPFVTGFKISEFDHFKKSFVLYYWKKKMKSACGPEISLVQNILQNSQCNNLCNIKKFYFFFDSA